MKIAVTIVTPPGYPHAEAFREVGETLVHGLAKLDMDAVLTTDLGLPGRTHLVLGSNLLPALGCEPPSGSILYNLEQVERGSPWLSPALLELLGRFRVWDYSLRNIEALRALGIGPVEHVPIGYVPELSRIGAGEEDIDVLFFGSVNERRLEVLRALEAKGIKVKALFGVYGAARDTLIARSKIVLNLHYYQAKVFEIVRVSYLLANRRFVVSERGMDREDEAELARGIAFADYADLVAVCEHYLTRPAQRARIAATGFTLFSRRAEPPLLDRALRSLAIRGPGPEARATALGAAGR